MRMMPRSSRSREDLLGEVRDVPRDLLGAELGVAGVDLVLVDVDRREHVVRTRRSRQDDGVLEVVALPRHERDEQVLAQRELAVVGRGAVGEDVALLDLVALAHERLLVDAGVLVRALELEQPVDLALPLSVLYSTVIVVAVDLGDDAVVLGEDHVGRVAGGAGLDAGADVGRLGPHQRHGLLLHVGAHERAVGVVVLEERDERRGHRDDLLRRHVHELDLVAAARSEISVVAPKKTSRSSCSLRSPSVAACGERRTSTRSSLKRAVGVERRVGLGDDVLLFLVGGEVHDLVGDLAVRRPCGTATR